jgi:hypothetical protein
MRHAPVLLLLLLAPPREAIGETIFASWSPFGGAGDVYVTRFDSEAPWLQEDAFPGAAPIPGVSLDFDPVTRQLWGFDYFECNITCPPPPHPVTIDPLTGAWSTVELPGLHRVLLQGQDTDIDPVTRELRYFGGSGQNYRYSLDLLQAFTDAPLSLAIHSMAVAHRPPIGGTGVETYVVAWYSSQVVGGPWFGLWRVGGPGGVPPASSGQLDWIGPVDLEAERLWLDISADGSAYLAAVNSFWPEGEWNKLYRIDLSSGALEEIGILAEPEGGAALAGIAIAPPGLGGSVVEVPSLSPVSVLLFALALGAAAFVRLLRNGRPEKVPRQSETAMTGR